MHGRIHYEVIPILFLIGALKRTGICPNKGSNVYADGRWHKETHACTLKRGAKSTRYNEHERHRELDRIRGIEIAYAFACYEIMNGLIYYLRLLAHILLDLCRETRVRIANVPVHAINVSRHAAI